MGLLADMLRGFAGAPTVAPMQERSQETPPQISIEGLRGIASGITNQPTATALLRESLGIADTATRAIANRVSSIAPLVKTKTKVRDGTETVEVLDDHPLKRLLDKPNPTFSRTQLMRLTAQYIVTVGDAAWVKVGSPLGIPVELHPLPPTHYTPVVSGGVVQSYAILDARGKRSEIPASDVVRFFFPDPENPYRGEGYLGPNATTVDAQKFLDQHLRSHYENDATPPIVLEPGPGAATPKPREWRDFLREWINRYDQRRGEFPGAPARLPAGWTAKELHRDSGAEVEPLLRYWLEAQLMNFGTPASILGRVVSGDRSSAETNQYVFDRHSILPIMCLIQDGITLQLAPDFDEDVFVEFEQFVAADKNFDLQREAQDLSLKVRSVNMVLQDRNADTVDWGEEPIGTLSDQVFDPDEGAGMEDEDADAIRSATPVARLDEHVRAKQARNFFAPDAAWARVLKTEKQFTKKLERVVRSIIEAQRKETIRRLNALTPRARVSGSDVFDPDEWLAMFRKRVGPVLRNIFEVTGSETLSAITGADFIFTTAVEDALVRESERLALQTGKTTLSQITRAMADATAEGDSIGATASKINREFGIRRRHAKTIARTEAGNASQQAQLEGFEQSGVVERKQWNTQQDGDVRDAHLIDGQVVALNENFILGDGLEAARPLDRSLPPEDVINCRCFLTPVIEGI